MDICISVCARVYTLRVEVSSPWPLAESGTLWAHIPDYYILLLDGIPWNIKHNVLLGSERRVSTFEEHNN